MSYDDNTKLQALLRADEIEERVGEDGCFVFAGRLPPERGARLLEALRMAEGEVRRAYRLLGRAPPRGDALRADALMWMVDCSLGRADASEPDGA